MAFSVIPALDLKGGKCVRLAQGDPARKTIELEDPLGVARRWERSGASRLHLVDLDGAIGGVRRNEPMVRKIVEVLAIPVQLGGGIRSVEDAARFLEMGAAKVILGTLALARPAAMEELASEYGPERLIVALDSRGGEVVVRGWREGTGLKAAEVVKRFEGLAHEILYTNVDVEGLLRGIDEGAIRAMVGATRLGVLVSGGVSTLEDVARVRTAGARGVIIGSALYTGRVDFQAARRYESL